MQHNGLIEWIVAASLSSLVQASATDYLSVPDYATDTKLSFVQTEWCQWNERCQMFLNRTAIALRPRLDEA